jgi:hypothetical protein
MDNFAAVSILRMRSSYLHGAPLAITRGTNLQH